MFKKLILGFITLGSMGLALSAVNINTATAEELKALPGIGAAKAKAIVEYREQHGAFKTVDELDNVKGIGPALLEKIRPEATVSGVAAKGVAKPAVSVEKKK